MTSVFLVGYTGSPASRRAIAFATTIACPGRTTTIAVNAYPIVPPSISPEAVMVSEADLQGQAEAEAERVLAALGDLDEVHERRAVAGPAPHALIETARGVDADLIAVGATGRGRIGRILPGSVAERLLHGAPCPVAVVPADWGGELRRIAVAYDDGAEARDALEAGRALAAARGAELTVLHVGEGGEAAERAAAQAGACCKQLAGSAGPALVDACCEDVDLLVCGSRSYGPLHALLAGCVSRHVVDRAPCPVLVIPRAAVRRLLPASGSESAAAG